jgi:hypothetical protein
MARDSYKRESLRMHANTFLPASVIRGSHAHFFDRMNSSFCSYRGNTSRCASSIAFAMSVLRASDRTTNWHGTTQHVSVKVADSGNLRCLKPVDDLQSCGTMVNPSRYPVSTLVSGMIGLPVPASTSGLNSKAHSIFDTAWNRLRSARCIPGHSLLPLPGDSGQ